MVTIDLTHLTTLEEFGPEIRRLHEEAHGKDYCLLHDVLKRLAEEGMETYKELGTNQGGTASAAVLEGFKQNIFIDVRFAQLEPYWHLFKQYEAENNISVEFREVDSTSPEAVTDEVDILLIDSLHKGYWLEKELAAHKDSVKYYICFHDTARQGQFRDLYPVIEQFVSANPEWTITEHCDDGAGYTVIKRTT